MLPTPREASPGPRNNRRDQSRRCLTWYGRRWSRCRSSRPRSWARRLCRRQRHQCQSQTGRGRWDRWSVHRHSLARISEPRRCPNPSQGRLHDRHGPDRRPSYQNSVAAQPRQNYLQMSAWSRSEFYYHRMRTSQHHLACRSGPIPSHLSVAEFTQSSYNQLTDFESVFKINQALSNINPLTPTLPAG